MIPAFATNSNSSNASKEKRPVSQPATTNTSQPEKKGALAWLRSLFNKLNDFIGDVARKIADVAKRSPLTIAAAAAIALLFLA